MLWAPELGRGWDLGECALGGRFRGEVGFFWGGGGLGSVQDLDRRGSELRARGGSWKKQVEESSS